MQILPRFLPVLSSASANPSVGLNPVQRWQLSSGTEVLALTLPEAPLVCVDLWCRAGSAFEQTGESGLAHLLEHMVFKGSARQPAGAFDLQIEALGGSSNAATGFDDVHYYVLVPPQAVGEAVELLLDLVLQPRLDAADLELERLVVLEELAQSQDQPDEMALQSLLELGCGNHPYGKAILGDKDQLEQHSANALQSFQQRQYRARDCVLALSGPLQANQLEALLRQLELSPLAALTGGSAQQQSEAVRIKPGRHRRQQPRLEAARLLMAWSVPGAAERRSIAALDVLTSVLAEGRRSRLVERLREQLQLVESIDLDLQVLERGSLVLLEAVCDPEDLSAVGDEIQAVLSGLIASGPEAAELQRADRLVANGYRFGLEAAAGVAGVIGNAALWNRSLDLDEPLQLLSDLNSTELAQNLHLLEPSLACTLEVLPA